MATTVQPILSCSQRTLSDITVSLGSEGTTFDVYLGVALLERVGADPDAVARKMLVGRLHNAGAPLVELGQTFGHDGRTVKRWGSALATGDIDEIARVFAGRAGRRKTSPELMRYAWQLYRERGRLGRNYREIIIGKIAEVFGVHVSTTTASALFAADPRSKAVPDGPPEQTTPVRSDSTPSVAEASSVNQSPIPLPVQTQPGVSGTQWIHHAGQALFANGMSGIENPLQRQFIGQILQGAVNVEQSKTLCLRSLANFTGPVLPRLKGQRDGLDELASESGLRDAYARNAELLCDGPDRGDLFYFDPHAKEYTGQLKVLKGWCGSRHSVVKALYLDSFHTRSGRPCFIRHYSPYYDMRERFFMSLARFDLLFDESRRQGRTFVIDRGIYSLPVLQSFGRDYVVTWEKGYQGGGWDDGRATIRFSRSRPVNDAADLHAAEFECQESPWSRDRAFRRILVRLHREGERFIELAVITSHPDMDAQDVVWTICRRWLQENDFKYLDVHFGINQMTSRDSLLFRDRIDDFEDRPVESVEYRELKSELRALEGQLARELLKLRRHETQAQRLAAAATVHKARASRLLAELEKDLENLKAGHPGGKAATGLDRRYGQLRDDFRTLKRRRRKNVGEIAGTEARIAGKEREIEPLEARLCETVRRQSRLQLLVAGEYRLLDPRKKAMMDALRVTASNIFRNVQERFRAIYDNFRDDHAFVRMLGRCSGTMARTEDAVVIRIWLPGTIQPYRIRAIEKLLAEIEEQTNADVSAPKSLKLQLIHGPQPV